MNEKVEVDINDSTRESIRKNTHHKEDNRNNRLIINNSRERKINAEK